MTCLSSGNCPDGTEQIDNICEDHCALYASDKTCL